VLITRSARAWEHGRAIAERVYDKVTMAEVREFFQQELATILPSAKLLYFT
jgi:hypothetical protein